MEPERLEDRLARLDDERKEADRLYNERLTAVDRALLRDPDFPHAPPAYDETQITPINESWRILPEDAADGSDRSLKGRLRGFIWRLVGPPLGAQQVFNAALVDHLNRNVSAHRETQRALTSTLALIRDQTASVLHFQAAMMSLLQSLTLYVDTKDRTVGGQVQVLNATVSALTDDWMKHWETQQLREDRRAAQHPALVQAYDDLSEKVSLTQQTALLLKREVERLLASPPAGAPSGPARDLPAIGSPVESLDAFKYVGFEDRFRGSQAKIREQLADYVPLFAGAAHVVDIGCGRGELLDLLREAGIGAHGVDVNASMVDICRERGLSAEVGGAVEYLERQPDASLDGLIAIQVVEHLEPSYLTRMLDVALHKLKPGAPLVLETLNPACWVAFFESYIRDVTHRWPLHPDTLRYLAQASGFSTVDVQFRAPVAEADRLDHLPPPQARPGHEPDPVLVDLVDVVNTHADKLNARLFTFMDYAIVARK